MTGVFLIKLQNIFCVCECVQSMFKIICQVEYTNQGFVFTCNTGDKTNLLRFLHYLQMSQRPLGW